MAKRPKHPDPDWRILVVRKKAETLGTVTAPSRGSGSGHQERWTVMKVRSSGIAARIKDVPPGTCFAFRREGTTYLAIRLREKKTATALWPAHPGGKLPLGQFSVDDDLWTQSLWVLPDAVATPQLGLSEVRYPESYRQQLGSLVLAGEDSMVTVPYRDEAVAWVRLSTGELALPHPSAFVWFERWSIVLPGPNGSLQTICTIPGQKISTVAADHSDKR